MLADSDVSFGNVFARTPITDEQNESEDIAADAVDFCADNGNTELGDGNVEWAIGNDAEVTVVLPTNPTSVVDATRTGPLTHLLLCASHPRADDFKILFQPSEQSEALSNASRNIEYFETMHHTRQGPQSLLSRCIGCGDPRLYAGKIHIADTLYSFLTTWLVKKLSPRECEVFSQILNYLTKTRPISVPEHYLPPPIPTSMSQCCKHFGLGAHAIPSWLPYPEIQRFDNDHVYISPIDCIRDSMAHGHLVGPFLLNDRHRVHTQTPRGQLIFVAASNRYGTAPNGEPLCLVCPGYLWFDDYQNNNVKDNRDKVWIMLLSICTPQSHMHTSYQTYLISLGPGESCHEHVMDQFYTDLSKLSFGDAAGLQVYFQPLGKLVPASLPVYSFAVDRPAKAKATGSASGKSTYHSCFGICGDLGQLWEVIPSCEECFQRRVENVISGECPRCHDWQVLGLEYLASDSYPDIGRKHAASGRSILVVKETTNAQLSNALTTAFTRLASANNQWTVKQASEYMRTEAIEKALQLVIISEAQDARLLVPIPTDNDLAELTPIPSSMRSADIDIWLFFSAIMHQFPLGANKAVFSELFIDWLKSNRKSSVWITDANTKILNLRRMRLVSLKLETITENSAGFGKFVSETYLATTRIAPWLISDIERFEPSDPIYEDPDKPIEEFRRKDSEGWLKARGIRFSAKSWALDLQLMCLHVMEDNGGVAPPVREIERQNSHVDQVLLLIQSLYCLNARVFVHGTIHQQQALDLERYVKLFLSIVERFDNEGRNASGTKQSVILAKFNLITLLKITEDTERFGGLRALYEGDGKAEGALTLFKPLCKTFNGDWSYNTARKYYEYRGLERVVKASLHNLDGMYSSDNEMSDGLKDLATVSRKVFGEFDGSVEYEPDKDDDTPDSANDQPERAGYKEFMLYKTEDHAVDEFGCGNSINVICFLDESEVPRFGMVLKGGSQMLELRLGYLVSQEAGSAYFNWELCIPAIDIPCVLLVYDSPNPSVVIQRRVISSCWKHNLLFLPRNVGLSSNNSHLVISTEWKELNVEGEIATPTITFPSTLNAGTI